MRIGDWSSDVCSSYLTWLVRLDVSRGWSLHQHEYAAAECGGDHFPDRTDLGADHQPDLPGCARIDWPCKLNMAVRRYASWLRRTPFHPQWLMPKRGVAKEIKECRGRTLDVGEAGGWRAKELEDRKSGG